jgi:hypothetical protein
MAQFGSDSLSPPNGERVGVRGKYLKIKSLLTPVLSSIGIEARGKNQIVPPSARLHSRFLSQPAAAVLDDF